MCCQIDVDVGADLLISYCIKEIVELAEIVKHTVLLEQFSSLCSRERMVSLIVFDTKYCKSDFFAHALFRLNIRKADASCLFFIFKKRIEHFCTILPNIYVPIFKIIIQLWGIQFCDVFAFWNLSFPTSLAMIIRRYWNKLFPFRYYFSRTIFLNSLKVRYETVSIRTDRIRIFYAIELEV